MVPGDLTKLKLYREVSIFNGTDLTGWRKLDEGYFDRPGEIRVEDGKLVLGKGDDLTGVCWKGEVQEENYEIAFQVRRVEGNDFFCGFTFPVEKSYVTLILGGWGGYVVGLTAINGASAAENSTTQGYDFKTGKWYEIRVSVTGKFIRVYRDLVKIIEVEREGNRFEVWPQMEVARPLSFSTYDTVGEYRNIRYMRLGKLPE